MNREEREAIRVRVDDGFYHEKNTYLGSFIYPNEHARQDIPALLDALEEAEELIQYLGACEDCHTQHEVIVELKDARIATLEMECDVLGMACDDLKAHIAQLAHEHDRAVALERALKKQVFACKDCVNFESRTKVFCDGCGPNDYKLWEFDQARFSGE